MCDEPQDESPPGTSYWDYFLRRLESATPEQRPAGGLGLEEQPIMIVRNQMIEQFLASHGVDHNSFSARELEWIGKALDWEWE